MSYKELDCQEGALWGKKKNKEVKISPSIQTERLNFAAKDIPIPKIERAGKESFYS